MTAHTRITPAIGPLAPISSTANEAIARQIVERIVQFRTAMPCGLTWRAFATAEILLALNAVSKRPSCRHGVRS
jgi:hypothetical protein